MRILIVAAVVVLALSGLADLYVNSTAAFHPARHLEYVVEQGDTLWAIAARFGPPQLDPRTYIHQIRKLNGLASANIHPGQVLRLPIR